MAKKIEYIRRDEAIRYAQWEGDYKVVMRLEEMKAADVQPVKRGKWEELRYNDYVNYYSAICSECGYESTDHYSIIDNHRYCEYCGARMDLKDGDAE